MNELAKHVLAGNYVKGDTVLIDVDGAGLLFGRKTLVDGKEVVTKKLDLCVLCHSPQFRKTSHNLARNCTTPRNCTSSLCQKYGQSRAGRS